MNIPIWISINEDPKQKQYLRENSYWYKYLNRNSIYYKQFLDSMKKAYKLTPTDKMNKIIDNINMLSTFLEVLK